jgi:hypothetical protein
MGFQYRDVNGYVKYTWTEENGWDKGTIETDPMMKVHICATGLNYGQQVNICLYLYIYFLKKDLVRLCLQIHISSVLKA